MMDLLRLISVLALVLHISETDASRFRWSKVPDVDVFHLRGENKFEDIAYIAQKEHRPLPVVLPDSGHTRLSVARQGLDMISRIEAPISVVAVIGPCRSGKSFLLNQLLSLSCNEGFGVGHLRETKTRGIWVWGEPLLMNVNGSEVVVLFMDTEGFESVGKSNVYDDRIFALASIMSSVLIYNLPETVREADIAKLSFAAELGEEFYGRVKGYESAFEPAKLLWLIQRDFLGGISVQQMVEDALQPVLNPAGNKDIETINRIRNSLGLMAQNTVAFSLPQPHLHRTKLCELRDSQLELEYIEKRENLKRLVKSMIKPKQKKLNGKEFVSLLEQTMEALNEGEFPSAGFVIDAFNKGLIDRCMNVYSEEVSKIRLPIPEEVVEEKHTQMATKVLIMFEKERFGRRNDTHATLNIELKKAFAVLKSTNEHMSAQQCNGMYTFCQDKLHKLCSMRVPSMSKFNAGLEECFDMYHSSCLGPSKAMYRDRIDKMVRSARESFREMYRGRLLNWVVVMSLMMVVMGRWVVKSIIVEGCAWIVIMFMEAYTRIFWNAYNPLWTGIEYAWESILDVDRWAVPLILCVGFVYMRYCVGWRRHKVERED